MDAQDAVSEAKEGYASEKLALDDLWEQWEAAYGFWDVAYGAAIGRLAIALTGSAPEGMRSVVDDLANADSPEEVASIWSGLSVEEQQRLSDGLPGFIGNLEGVPYGDRMLANRAEFDRVMAAGPHGEPLDSELADLAEEVRRGGEMLAFRPFESPQATAAVVYGVEIVVDEEGKVSDPLAGASNINVLVGGMFSGLGDLTVWGKSARDLNDASQGYGAEKSVTTAWYGYDSPDLVTEIGMDKAEEGASTLTSMLRGLRNAAPSGSTTTVVGHSYGSTTAFLAVGTAQEDLGVDRLVAVGSAGVPTSLYLAQRDIGPERSFSDSLPELDFGGTDVYASRAPGDAVGWFGQLTSDGHSESPESYPGRRRSRATVGGFLRWTTRIAKNGRWPRLVMRLTTVRIPCPGSRARRTMVTSRATRSPSGIWRTSWRQESRSIEIPSDDEAGGGGLPRRSGDGAGNRMRRRRRAGGGPDGAGAVRPGRAEVHGLPVCGQRCAGGDLRGSVGGWRGLRDAAHGPPVRRGGVQVPSCSDR